MVKHIVKKHDGDKFWSAKNEEEAEAMWTGRKNGHYAVRAYAGEGARAWSTDVWCVLTCGCCPHSLIPPPSFVVMSLQRPDLEASTARI